MGREFLSKSFWSWTVELRKAFRVLIPCSDTERRWEALENGRQAIWANTESHQAERPQLLHFLAAAVCSLVFFPLFWGSPTRLSAAQPFHDWTKWGNTKVYYVASSSRPLLRRNESSKYFYGSKIQRGGKGNLRQRELGEWEKGSVWRYGRDTKVSLHHLGLYLFKEELHRFLWFLPSLFYKSGEKKNRKQLLSRACKCWAQLPYLLLPWDPAEWL